MHKSLMAGAMAVALVGADAAYAGNIVLTGHDNDYHWNFGANPGNGGPAGLALGAELGFVRAGSTNSALPVLVIDTSLHSGVLELGNAATSLLGAANVVVKAPTAITAADFNPATYSAFAVASELGCGGCDLTPAEVALVTAQSAAIADFLNAGGGILGLTGDGDPLAYAYVPASASNPGGSPPSTGYVQTAFGASLSLPPVNGNPTHNFFSEPGSGGLAAAYGVTERLGSATTGIPETVACVGCTTSVLVAAPEPGSLALLGTGLLGLAAALRRKRRSARSAG